MFRNGTSCITGAPLPSTGRDSSFRLISRGLGVSSGSPKSGRTAAGSTLRRKRVPAAPSFGSARLFQLPSAVRKWLTPGGGVMPLGAKPTNALAG